jgi:serine/threonine-protein kinase
VIGHTISHYKLTERIGAGGMGEVYRATDSKLHRDVAVKVISEEFARDPERMARFEREAQVLASLTHASIAAVYGIEESDGHRAIVMELVKGEDLSDRLRRGPMPLEEAMRTALHIAEGLEAAHDHGVIHRDLKPGNIKVLESGAVKLLDFGLAKALEESAPAHLTKGDAATLSVAATRAGIILGTAGYMSPEQATGSAADKRSDVWSFGVVLFEMLTGQRLFEGQTTSHVLADVIRAEIDFNRLPPNTPADLRTLIERALERDPRRRLRDIREARLTLERLLERGSGRHSVIASGPMTMPRVGRRLDLWQVLAGVLIVALAAAAIAGWMRPSPPAPNQLRLASRMADGDLFLSVGSAFDLSPDGRQIAIVTGNTNDPSSGRLVVRRLNELNSTVLITTQSQSDTREFPYNPFFSPDGEWVGYAIPGELRKVPTAGGTPLTICAVARSRGASWGPDGTIVFAPSPNSALSRVSAAGGEPQPLTKLNTEAKEATHRWPQILPGGEAVLFTSHTSATSGFDNATIEVVKIATGERSVVHKGGGYARYVPSGHLVYVHNNTLLAVPFDLKQLKVTGPAAPAVQNVTANAAEGVAQYAFSNDSGSTARSRSSWPSSAAISLRNSGRRRAVARPRSISPRSTASCARRSSMLACAGCA